MTFTFVPKKRSYHKEYSGKNMKTLSLTIQKLRPMLMFFVDRQIEEHRAKSMLYALDLPIWGHKNPYNNGPHLYCSP